MASEEPDDAYLLNVLAHNWRRGRSAAELFRAAEPTSVPTVLVPAQQQPAAPAVSEQ
ncbi:hypothetical protein [Streptomyces sp. NPDC001450]